MGKFTDSPYFLIDHYLNTINYQLEEDIKSMIVNMWPVIFTDWDGAKFVEFNDISWNFEYETIEGPYSKKQVDYSYQASYLIGPKTGIIAKGGRIVELFVKDSDYGFRQINVTPPTDYKDGNFFNFYKHISLPFQYGSTLSETVSGNNYYFEVYVPTVAFDPDDINGKEVYFRKDSQFHQWLINYARDYFYGIWNESFVIRNYVNTDKQFLYFGNIYHKREDNYHIEFYGMKDFVGAAIPEHQLTTNIKEFINVQFDRVYQETYNLLKNIWSLIDPYEVDEAFLGYLAKFYNINVDNQSIDIRNQREFIREMIQYLKRKGSYSSFYSAWKVLTQGTRNDLHIFEKWIDRSFVTESVSGEGTIAESELIYISYVDQYNVNPLFDQNDYIITPYYKVQIDLSNEAMSYSSVLPKIIVDSLVYQWEELRPVNKVAEYEIFLPIEIGLTGNTTALYGGDQDRYNTNVISSVKKFTISVPDAYIQIYGGGYNSFLVEHGLNSSNLFIRCYDMNFDEVVPSSVDFLSRDNIRVTFSDDISSGFMLIKRPNITAYQSTELNTPWRIRHQFLQKELYIEFNQFDEKVYSDSLQLIDHELFVTNMRSGSVNISKPDIIHIQYTESVEWLIEHNLGYKGVLISSFDINNTEIIPKDVKFVDVNSSILVFEKPVSGFAVVVSVGNPLFADMLLEEVVIDGVTTFVLPYYEANELINEQSINDYKARVTSSYETNDDLYLIIDLPQHLELSIREIKIYDSNNNILIYTECGEIFKPMNVKMRIEYKVNKYTTKGSL